MRKFFLLIIFITLFFATAIYVTFRWGSEWVSTLVADIIPIEMQKQMGQSIITSLEMQELQPSSLSLFTQHKIRQNFFQVLGKDSTTIQLIFKNVSYPNAFALPGNYIILLDSLVRMSKDTIHYTDITGVLAHEAGHLHYKHSLKLMIKSGITAAVIGYFIGDISAFVATLTHQLLSLSYSRDYEREADDYAIRVLQNHHISTIPLAELLETMSNSTSDVPEFLSTHPITKERVERLKGKNL